MNRTDRLLAIVLELQGRDLVTAEELAHTFEVTKRTIYRDIQALNESGVPVVSVAGQGYWLMEGYFLPPVSLSPDEAIMLVLGSDVMAHSFDAQYQQAAASASRKIEALLQKGVQKEVTYLRDNIRFISSDSQRALQKPELLQQLRRAIIEQKTVHIHYTKKAYSKEQNKSKRFVDPHSLIHLNNNWMLSAYCHLRNDIRMFRLDRIAKLELNEEKFVRQEGFDVHKLTGPNNLHTVVELLFDKDIANWVKERPVFYVTSLEDVQDGLKATLKVRAIEECLAWVLSWGAKVKVISPERLKVRLEQELHAMLAKAKG